MSTLFVCIKCLLFILITAKLLLAEIIIINKDRERETFSDIELMFTVPVPDDGLEGKVIEAYPIDACSNITAAPTVNTTYDWFALIEGGSCSYDVKVYYAETAGYSSAIIYNVDIKNSVTPRWKSVYFGFTNISAVAVSTHTGLVIKDKYLYSIDDRCRVFIFPNNPFNIVTFLLLFAIVAGTFILMMLIFMVIKCIQQTRNQRNNRLSSRHLKELRTTRYKEGDPYDVCSICLEEYSVKDRLRILPCHHAFHCKCIDPWLTNNKRTCPICKQKVVLTGIHSENETESDTDGRAETRPLLRGAGHRYAHHGTFSGGSANNYFETMPRASSGETTSRDVTSAAFDETSGENTPSNGNIAAAAAEHYDSVYVSCDSFHEVEKEKKNVCENTSNNNNTHDYTYSSDGSITFKEHPKKMFKTATA